MTINLKANFNIEAYKAALEQIGKQMAAATPAVARLAAGLEVLSGTVPADAQTTKRAQATVYRNTRDCLPGDELFRVGEMWVRFVELPDGVCVWLPEGRDVSAYLSINGIKPIRPGRTIDTTGEEKAARAAGERLSGAIMRKQFPTPSEMRAREKLERTGQAPPDGALFPSPAAAKRIAEEIVARFGGAVPDMTWNQWRGGVPGVAADGNGGLGPADRSPTPRAKPTLPEPRPARKRKLAKPEEEL